MYGRRCVNLFKQLCARQFVRYYVQRREYPTEKQNKFYTSKFSPENRFARDIFKARGTYILWEQLVPFAIAKNENETGDTKDISPAKALMEFERIADEAKRQSLCITSNQFIFSMLVVLRHCPRFTDDQLIRAHQIFAQVPVKPENFNKKIWQNMQKTLVSCCFKRCHNWDLEQLFLICDIWIGAVHDPPTAKKLVIAISKIFETRAGSMTPSQLVQALFVINWLQQPTPNMTVFVEALDKSIDKLSLEECGIAAMGFFRTETKVNSNELISKIYRKLLQADLKKYPDIALSMILKLLRSSSSYEHKELMGKLFEKFHWDAENRDTMTLLQIAILGIPMRIFNQHLLEIISKRFLENLNSLRNKDLERFTLALCIFDFKSKSGIENDILMAILNELPKRTVHDVYFLNLYRCMNFLAIKNYFNMELISYYLDPYNLEKCYGSPDNFEESIYDLDTFVRINLKQTYNGNKLNDATRLAMTKRLRDGLPAGKAVLTPGNVVKSIKDAVESNYSHHHTTSVLPIFLTSTFVTFDTKTGKAVDTSRNFPSPYSIEIPTKKIVTEGKDNLEVVAIVSTINRNYSFAKELEPSRNTTAHFKYQINQLKLLGFHPIVIPYLEWLSLKNSQQFNYLHNKIMSNFGELNIPFHSNHRD